MVELSFIAFILIDITNVYNATVTGVYNGARYTFAVNANMHKPEILTKSGKVNKK
jgi:hypothetical protein